jgi:predicted DNA-binding transcriptional regulator
MKEVYLNCDLDKTEQFIDKIQNNFAEIFKHEELIKSKSFRGELSLDHILRLHLRVIDDGSKINGNNNDKSKFYSPSISDNIEQSVLEYISERLESFKDNKDKKIAYVDNLSTKFKESVCFFCEELVNIDKENPLIGDCLILERDISIEFYILLYHLNKKDLLNKGEFVEKWERLLYTRDFHDRYYRVWYRDDFQELYLKICSNEDVIGCLNDYVQKGFRPKLMDNNDLHKTVIKFIDDKKEDILKNAYNLWFSNKLIYLLYKYEINNSDDKKEVRNQLREIIKSGYSREHILPQVGWEEFIEETVKDKNQIEKIKNSVKDVINGIGNLLIVTKSLNSENGNKHPSKKTYPSEWGISYKNHKGNQSEWNNPENWERIIEERGKKIFEYLRENLLRDLNLKN